MMVFHFHVTAHEIFILQQLEVVKQRAARWFEEALYTAAGCIGSVPNLLFRFTWQAGRRRLQRRITADPTPSFHTFQQRHILNQKWKNPFKNFSRRPP